LRVEKSQEGEVGKGGIDLRYIGRPGKVSKRIWEAKGGCGVAVAREGNRGPLRIFCFLVVKRCGKEGAKSWGHSLKGCQRGQYEENRGGGSWGRRVWEHDEPGKESIRLSGNPEERSNPTGEDPSRDSLIKKKGAVRTRGLPKKQQPRIDKVWGK